MGDKDDDRDTNSSDESLSDKQPLLDRLVPHFVASKKSLASTSHIWRANEIVTSARTLIENIASLNAKNSFLRRAIDGQVEIARAVKHGVEVVSQDGQSEFEAVLRNLDAADSRVKRTIELLKITTVEATLQSPDEEGQRCLFDFLNEKGVDELTTMLHNSIDHINQAQIEFANSNEAFNNELRSIQDVLRLSTPMTYGHDTSSTTPMFRSLESHATEMADLLQSLVRHYDLCITALKHTEGGGEAAEQAHVDLPEGLAVDKLDDNVPAPITEEERSEMMQVLQNDAFEVEEAVQEIANYAAEMELQLEQIDTLDERLRKENTSLRRLVAKLHDLGEHIPCYIAASSKFASIWSKEKQSMEDMMGELDGLRDFYDDFSRAYDDLVIEIGRRKAVKAKMEKIVKDAMSKVENLYNEDLEERKSFTEDQGRYLPSDIWPGLSAPPSRFEIRLVDHIPIELPWISAETMEKVAQRHRGRLGTPL